VAERYVLRNSRTAWRVYDGEAVILLADDSTLNTLNPVGTLIWESADGATPVSALVRRICAEFDVDAARAEQDVSVFVDKLHQRGLLEISVTPHSAQ
jgi:hypothetical protein